MCQSFGCTAIGVNNCCADSGWLNPQNQLYSHNFDASQYIHHGCWNTDRPLYTCVAP